MIEVEDKTLEPDRAEEYELYCEDRSQMWILYYALYKLLENPVLGDLAARPLSKKGYGVLVDWVEDLEKALSNK